MVRASLLVLILSFSAFLQAEAIARLDRNVMAENETVTLTIELDSTKFTGGPDIQALENDFEVYNQGRSTNSQWINGKGSSKTIWTYTLQPKQAGVFTIPAFKIGKEATQALSLQVKRVQNSSGTSNDAVFLEVETDKTQVKVQEQIRLTLRVNFAQDLSDLSITPVDIPTAKVIEGQKTQYDRSINGRGYRSYEMNYFIYPQQSGELIIPELRADVVVPRSQRDFMWGTGQRLVLRSQPISIDVQANARAILGAKQLHIEESWSADPSQLEVGDSIQRTIVQKAQGVLAEQLDDIPTVKHKAMRVYSEAPSFENRIAQDGNTGIRSDSMAIVITEPGLIHLPAIEVPWFNTETLQEEVAILPAIELQVKGQTIALSQVPITEPQMQQQDSDKSPADASGFVVNETKVDKTTLFSWLWPLATLLCLLVIAVLSFRLYRLKNAALVTTEAVNATNNSEMAWRTFKQAAFTPDAQAVRQNLLAWAKANWPEKKVNALADIKSICADQAVTEQLHLLDKALYQGANSRDFMALLAALEKHKTTVSKTHNLYPTA